MSGIAVGRLTEERKNWRKDHPLGFHARPVKKADNSNDIMSWETGIPGKAGTDWEGGVFKVTMDFPEEYPSKSSGNICLSILKEDDGWRPAITIKQMLLGIQDLLDNPNESDPAQMEASKLYRSDKAGYRKKIKEQALKNVPDS